MTEDDLDLLASAYLDGEATSEEVVMVERDPELRARVERLRAVSARVSAPVSMPSPTVMEQHLAAALAEFDNPTAAAPTVKVPAGEVVDLNERASRPRRGRSASSKRAANGQQRSMPRRSIPQWLPAAAAFLLLGGGVVWLASQTGSSSDDSAALDTTTEAGESADFEAEELNRSSAAVESSAADDADSSDGDAADSAEADAIMMDEEAAESEEAMEEAPEDEAADGAEDAEEDVGQSTSTTVPALPTTGGFFPNEPVMSFADTPDPDTVLDELPEIRFDLSDSRCGGAIEGPDGLEPVAYLPIEIAGSSAEVIVLIDESGTESATIVDSTCAVLLP